MLDLVLGRFDPLERRNLVVVLIGSALLVLVRLFVAMPFWSSGLTKWVAFPTQLSASAKYLFNQEYKLHLFGNAYDMPFPELLAFGAGLGEIILPVLLIAGLLSRPAAVGLLGMTAIIQLVYPGGWTLHAQWALAAGVVAIAGPGVVSLDWVLRRVLPRNGTATFDQRA